MWLDLIGLDLMKSDLMWLDPMELNSLWLRSEEWLSSRGLLQQVALATRDWHPERI